MLKTLPLTLSRVPKKSSLKFCITFLVVATLSNFSPRVYIKPWLWCYSISMQLQVRDQGNILKSSGSTAAESLLKELQPCLAFNKLCSSVRPVSIFTVGSQSKFSLKTHIQQIYILLYLAAFVINMWHIKLKKDILLLHDCCTCTFFHVHIKKAIRRFLNFLVILDTWIAHCTAHNLDTEDHRGQI